MLCSRHSRFWIVTGIVVGTGFGFCSAPQLIAASGNDSSDSAPELAAANGSIELYNVKINPDGSVGSVEFGVTTAPVTLLGDGSLGKVAFAVYARLAGETLPGVAGGEFYLEGLEQLPPGWIRWVIPAYGLVDVGAWSDPSGGIRRVTFAWEVDGPEDVDCQKEAFVFLGRVELMSLYGDPNLYRQVRVVAGNPPFNPAFPCPKLFLCNAPIYTEVCVTGGEFHIGRRVPDVVNPVPADGAVDLQPDVVLAWEYLGPYFCDGIGTGYTSVYFGTSADPPHAFTNYDGVQYTFDPPDLLAPNTTYYWRINSTPDFDCGFDSSPVWSFTTGNPIGVESTSWATVKSLFRE